MFLLFACFCFLFFFVGGGGGGGGGGGVKAFVRVDARDALNIYLKYMIRSL